MSDEQQKAPEAQADQMIGDGTVMGRFLGVVVAMSGGVIKVPKELFEEAMEGIAVMVLVDKTDDTYMAVVVPADEAREMMTKQQSGGEIKTTPTLVDPKKLN